MYVFTFYKELIRAKAEYTFFSRVWKFHVWMIKDRFWACAESKVARFWKHMCCVKTVWRVFLGANTEETYFLYHFLGCHEWGLGFSSWLAWNRDFAAVKRCNHLWLRIARQVMLEVFIFTFSPLILHYITSFLKFLLFLFGLLIRIIVVLTHKHLRQKCDHSCLCFFCLSLWPSSHQHTATAAINQRIACYQGQLHVKTPKRSCLEKLG